MTLAHLFWRGWDGMPFDFGLPELIFGILGFVFWAGFWVLVVILLVQLARRGGRAHSSAALDLLEQRYARGEITRDEFLERKAVLQGAETPPPSV